MSRVADEIRALVGSIETELAEMRAYRDRTEAALLELSTSARHMRERNLERNAIIAQLQMHGLWREGGGA